MPLYTYHCPQHGDFDIFLKLSQIDRSQWCPECGLFSKKIIVHGHGGIQTDENVPWLDDGVRETLQDSDNIRAGVEKPIETRKEWKEHLEKNNIVPAE